jgi:hypothetical protein
MNWPSDPLFRRSVCAAGQPAYPQVRRRIGRSGSDREFPSLTGRSGTQRHVVCSGARRPAARRPGPCRHPASYALRGCSRALLADSRRALASCSQVVSGGDHWLLMVVRGHLGARARTAQARFSAGRRRRTTVRFLGRTWPHVAMRYLSVGPCCRAPLLAICCCCCCRLGRGRCRPGVDHGSSDHKVTARWTASWITELSRSARVSATSCSSQDATKVTGPSGGSG